FPRRCLSAGENIEFVGLGVLAVGQNVKLQEKTMEQFSIWRKTASRTLGARGAAAPPEALIGQTSSRNP
ncbi:MAG: hypothetical protein ACOYOU_13405, partial [Kiritimatiellia bacterium]